MCVIVMSWFCVNSSLIATSILLPCQATLARVYNALREWGSDVPSVCRIHALLTACDSDFDGLCAAAEADEVFFFFFFFFFFLLSVLSALALLQ